MTSPDPTRRFSDRVDDYVRYRPRYPEEIVPVLVGACDLSAASAIADVGSGTGILAEIFLRAGCRVFGVEPNREMREAGERSLCTFPAFASIDGTAEATTLPTASADFVTAGQAFHWFDRHAARAEFGRILRPRGWVVLVWNRRRKSGSPFLEGYEQLLQHRGVDYAEVDHDRITADVIASFYAPGSFVERRFVTRQTLDAEAARGRLESSSYTPRPGHPDHDPMLDELAALFDETSRDGVVTLEYDTLLYYGRLDR